MSICMYIRMYVHLSVHMYVSLYPFYRMYVWTYVQTYGMVLHMCRDEKASPPSGPMPHLAPTKFTHLPRWGIV